MAKLTFLNDISVLCLQETYFRYKDTKSLKEKEKHFPCKLRKERGGCIIKDNRFLSQSG